MKITKAILLLAGVLMLLMYPVYSKADTITLSLGIGNIAISGYQGPYATVVVDRTSATTADIEFTALAYDSTYQYLLVDGNIAAVNVNAASFVVSNLAGSTIGTGFSGVQLTYPANGNVSDFGTFNLALDNKDSFKWALGTVTFTVTASGANWQTAADVLTENSDGYMARAHIAVTYYPAVQSNNALETGYAANSSVTVPEPGILILLGIAMSAIGAASYRIRKL